MSQARDALTHSQATKGDVYEYIVDDALVVVVVMTDDLPGAVVA